MTRFVEGATDVLVCSSIIENGLDVPNANTLIVTRADRFGLSQMYQIRGRVGRWDRRAYCYLIVPGVPRRGNACRPWSTTRTRQRLPDRPRLEVRARAICCERPVRASPRLLGSTPICGAWNGRAGDAERGRKREYRA